MTKLVIFLIVLFFAKKLGFLDILSGFIKGVWTLALKAWPLIPLIPGRVWVGLGVIAAGLIAFLLLSGPVGGVGSALSGQLVRWGAPRWLAHPSPLAIGGLLIVLIVGVLYARGRRP